MSPVYPDCGPRLFRSFFHRPQRGPPSRGFLMRLPKPSLFKCSTHGSPPKSFSHSLNALSWPLFFCLHGQFLAVWIESDMVLQVYPILYPLFLFLLLSSFFYLLHAVIPALRTPLSPVNLPYDSFLPIGFKPDCTKAYFFPTRTFLPLLYR